MDRTIELLQKAQVGDKAAKEQLVQENMGLVWSIVKKFNGRGVEVDDLFQIGSIGLLKCIDKFDISYNVKFSTYAVPMIMGEIKKFLRDDGIIKVSRSLKDIAIKAKYAQENLMQKNGAQPTINELAAAIDVQVEDLILAQEATLDLESLYSTVHQSEGNSILLIDKLEQEEDQEESMVNEITLRQIINDLKPKERQIIIMRYFDDKTQSEVASVVGISQVQVSRIEKKVLQTIREKFG